MEKNKLKFRLWSEDYKQFYYCGFDIDMSLFPSPPDFMFNKGIIDLQASINKKDINDNEIYEGDIIKTKHAVGIITLGEYGFNIIHYGYYVKWINNDHLRNDILFWINDEKKTIIGNIYENKQLIENKI